MRDAKDQIVSTMIEISNSKPPIGQSIELQNAVSTAKDKKQKATHQLSVG